MIYSFVRAKKSAFSSDSKNMKKKIFTVIILAVFSFSCFSADNVEPPEKDEKVVTNEINSEENGEVQKNASENSLEEKTDEKSETQEENSEEPALSEKRVKDLEESFRVFATEGAKFLKRLFEASSASLEEVIKNLENPAKKESEENAENTTETVENKVEQEKEEKEEKPLDESEIRKEEVKKLLNEEKTGEKNGFTYTKEVVVPPPSRPLPPDGEKAAIASKRDETPETFDKNVEFLQYATADELAAFIEKKIKEDDPRYGEVLYDVFQKNTNIAVRVSILRYFSYLHDPCLADFAVEDLSAPLENPPEILKALFDYVYEANITQASPAIVYLVMDDMSEYFSPSFRALSNVGDEEEAAFLSELLEDPSLSLADRQALMRALGELHAINTFETLAACAEDEDENTFVRMYAAEAIGKMQKAEALKILLDLISTKDPNLREYCVKGLENFSSDANAKKAVIESIRDSHYKVRIAAMQAAAKNGWGEATKAVIFRAKNDKEGVVQENAYKTLSTLNTDEANSFLIDEIKGEKTSEYKKILAAKALFENEKGESEILELAKDSLLKKRRYLILELGKLFIKYAKASYGEICRLYLSAKDSETVSQGLALYQNGRYSECTPLVNAISLDAKAPAVNRNKAKKLMGIE